MSAPSAEASAVPASVTGTWEGAFTATKGSVTVPDSVKDTTRGKDDGKSGVGAGKVRLAVSAAGEITGSITGALGKDSLQGRVEVEGARTMLRASAIPDDPVARDAMAGILVGELKGDTFHVELHVAAGDAVTVREAAFDLKRTP